MKRSATAAILLAATAAGFAAGWFRGAEEPLPAASQPARAGTAYTPVVTTAPVPAPLLAKLDSVEDCQIFLAEVNRKYAASHPYTRRAIRDYTLRRWLELDAESALVEAERQPGNEFSTEGFAPDLFRVWLDLNVESAISAFNQANPILAKNVRLSFLTALADKDPEKAFAVWKTGRGQIDKKADPAAEEIFRRWAQRDPRQAIEKAPGGFEQEVAVNEWAQNEPKEALAWARTRPGNDAYMMSAAFLPALLQTDPVRAQKTLGEMNPLSLESAGRNWAERDTAGAIAWAEGQAPNAPLVREVFVAAAAKLAYTDPERALEILRVQARQAPSPPRDDRSSGGAMRGVFAVLAAADPEKIRQLVAEEPELGKGGGMAGYFTYAFASDPAAAIAQYREWAENPALKEAAAAAVLATFEASRNEAVRDPSELIAAVPELADKVDGRILRGWARANPMAAAEFITQRIAAGKSFDNLHQTGVLSELAVSQPQYTSLWLQRLRNPDLQIEAAETLAVNWAAFDPEAAAAWINGLSDGSVRQAAMDGFERRQRGRRNPAEDE